MLSPHEFATLMLVRHAPDQIDMNRAELDALLERQLVMLEHSAEGHRRAQLTEMGRSFLEAFSPNIGSAKNNPIGKMALTARETRGDQY
jgi:hypothetical protein